ncbi:MAG: methyltransferase domain-containing protein [Alphaproteobacteria bacterium]|nr:methyltransferase domain-containing protein [Alphaproteobacteria bacterium]
MDLDSKRMEDGGDVASDRLFNRTLGENYDRVDYAPGVEPRLEHERLLGIGALFGCCPAGRDVLDLGCGWGVPLARAAAMGGDRLTGLDISRRALAQAEARCAPFGSRCRLEHVDLLDVRPEDLGTYDLVYNVGVYYVAPEAVRRRLVDLIGRCVGPGGIAVVTYYAGPMADIRERVYRLLREASDSASSPSAAVAAARSGLAALKQQIQQTTWKDMLLEELDRIGRAPDSLLYHEGLNSSFAAVETLVLAREMERYGLHFLAYSGPGPSLSVPSSSTRAAAASTYDLSRGGYRYAVFGKPPGSAFDIRTPLVTWQASLTRTLQPDGSVKYVNIESGRSVVVTRPAIGALVDRLVAGPANWQQLVAAAGTAASAEPPAVEAQSALTKLWQ